MKDLEGYNAFFGVVSFAYIAILITVLALQLIFGFKIDIIFMKIGGVFLIIFIWSLIIQSFLEYREKKKNEK